MLVASKVVNKQLELTQSIINSLLSFEIRIGCVYSSCLSTTSEKDAIR